MLVNINRGKAKAPIIKGKFVSRETFLLHGLEVASIATYETMNKKYASLKWRGKNMYIESCTIMYSNLYAQVTKLELEDFGFFISSNLDSFTNVELLKMILSYNEIDENECTFSRYISEVK